MTAQATAISAVSAKPKSRRRSLLDRLIYEVVEGKPIYYKGYQKVLNGHKTIEEIMSDSSLQAWLKGRIYAILLQQLLNSDFDITVGEQGFILGKKHQRAADLAIFRTKNLVLNNHYSKLPPEVVVEIDISADLADSSDMEYIFRKVADYFAFGVKKVFWVFTEQHQVMIALPDQPAQTVSWTTDILVLEGVTFNIATLLAQAGRALD
ncbi:MAG: Uma2 family endonuclease [Saprospiraceae bacterium]